MAKSLKGVDIIIRQTVTENRLFNYSPPVFISGKSISEGKVKIKKKHSWLMVAVRLVALLLLTVCTASAEEAPAIGAPVTEKPDGETAVPASIVKGGAIYDNMCYNQIGGN